MRSGYDALGRATSVTNAWGTGDQAVSRTTFDAGGRVIYTVDARGNTNAFGYDAASRRTSLTNAWGSPLAQLTAFAYDGAGNQTNMTDAVNGVTEFRYDPRNRRTQTILPAVVAGGPKFTNSVAYDLDDRHTSDTNAAGILSLFGYDGVGRLLSVTNGLGSGTATNWATFAYDEAGNLTNQVDALNRATSFGYDTLGRRLWRKLPGLQTTSFTYDSVGNLLGVTSADNIVITNQYDVMNRLWKRWQTGTNFETYTYSASGRLNNRVDASGTHSWVYDARDRVCTNTTPVGTLKYSYDANGNQLTLQSTTASGVNITYAYDALNRLTNVLDNALTNSTKNTSYGFDAVGNLQCIKLNPIAPTAVTNYYQYDAQNRLTNMLWKVGGTTLGSFGYTLNSLGSRTQLIQSLSTQPTTFTWGYDALQRLTSEAVSGGTPSGTLSYTFDLVGNRKSRSAALGLGGQTLNYDQNDWLDNDSTTNNATLYFDPKGNTRTNVWDGAARQYGYDWANRLTTFTNGATTAAFTYDADGNRTKKVVGATTTWFLVATINPTGYPQVMEEHTGASPGTVSRRYTYGLDLISQTTGSTNQFFGTDGLGSTRFLLGDTGSLIEHYGYDAYGSIIVSNTTPSTIYLFVCEQWDPELGLSYNRARYLNVGLGRFWTMDTFEGKQSDPLSLHKYLYCQGTPVNMKDPNGHEGSLIETTLSEAIGVTLDVLNTVYRVHRLKNKIESLFDLISMFRDVVALMSAEEGGGLWDAINTVQYGKGTGGGGFYQGGLNNAVLDVFDSVGRNLPTIVAANVKNFQREKELVSGFEGGNSTILVYLPNLIRTPRVEFSSGLRVQNRPIKLVAGGAGAGRIFGIGMKSNSQSPFQVFRTDYIAPPLFRSHTGSSDNDIDAWIDPGNRNFNYQVPRGE